jgi:small subunit ribosomal protein S4
MARYTGPVCRLCRRERTKLYLKGDRQRQGSEYLTQLREKQKARRIYGILEKQFRNLYEEASHRPGMTGTNLLQFLELRLDNIAYRAGWGASRAQARQLVRHGHVTIDAKRVTIPSYRVRPGEVIALKPVTRENFNVKRNLDVLDRTVPGWLEKGDNGFNVTVRIVPQREQIDESIKEQLIVELYSK